MEWKEIKDRLTEVKNTFNKFFKCLNKNRNIQEGTITKHAKIPVVLVVLVYKNREKLNQSQNYSYG